MNELIDTLTKIENTKIVCLDKGFVQLIDCMPRLISPNETGDHAITEAARNSYKGGTKTVNEDKGLIRFLMRHRHTGPFEMCEFKFHCKMPIFVARQWVRHRMASINEMSARYSILPNEFYFPDIAEIRQQSKSNKQGTDQPVEETTAVDFLIGLEKLCDEAYAKYERALANGIGREQARMELPINIYTEWFWKIDLKNLLDFLALRADSHAQKEIQVYADAIIKLITPIVPWSMEAWEDYNSLRKAILFTRLELEVLSAAFKNTAGLIFDHSKIENKRERNEFIEKLSKLGIKI